jgi:hypothetical protein
VSSALARRPVLEHESIRILAVRNRSFAAVFRQETVVDREYGYATGFTECCSNHAVAAQAANDKTTAMYIKESLVRARIRRHDPFGSNPIGVSCGDFDAELLCFSRRSGKALVHDAAQPIYPLASRTAAEQLLHGVYEAQNLVILRAKLGAISMQPMPRFVEMRMIRRSKEYHDDHPDNCGNGKKNGENFNHYHSTAARNRSHKDKQTH